nr:hypothetical protein CE91St29_12500 [Corynebacterium striatum]
MEIRKLNIAAVDACEEVIKIVAWRGKTHGSDCTPAHSILPAQKYISHNPTKSDSKTTNAPPS